MSDGGAAKPGDLGTGRVLAGLSGDDRGATDGRPPLVLLHGLTFDRTMWDPALMELQALDPGRRLLALDLPGHGASAPWVSYDIEGVADGVHRAVEEAGLEAPVMVGHSMSAIVASLYASAHPTSGVVNVDQSLQTAPFATMLQSMADQLRGPAFRAMWEHFLGSMHIELLPPAAQDLVRSTCRPDQELVLGYWRQLLEGRVGDVAAQAAQGMAVVGRSGVPYLIVAGAEPDADYQTWLYDLLPQATITVWPDSGHFPHLAQPRRFAEVLAATAHWPAAPSAPSST